MAHMITTDMKSRLHLLGYTDDDIRNMTPQNAWEAINSNININKPPVTTTPVQPRTPSRRESYQTQYESPIGPKQAKRKLNPYDKEKLKANGYTIRESELMSWDELQTAFNTPKQRTGKVASQPIIQPTAATPVPPRDIDDEAFRIAEERAQMARIDAANAAKPADVTNSAKISANEIKAAANKVKQQEKEKAAADKQTAKLLADLDKDTVNRLKDRTKALKTEHVNDVSQAWTEAHIENKQRNAAAKILEQQTLSATNLAKVQTLSPKAIEMLRGYGEQYVDPTQARVEIKQKPRGWQEVKSTTQNEFGRPQSETVMINAQGQAVESLGKKFKSFGEQLRQNYSEVLRWSIAVSLLYGPMQKLNQLVTDMISNQTELAQVAVTLGTSQELNNQIFSEATAIAQKTGTSVEGVLEGYNLAVRSVGEYTSQTDRLAKAQTMLVSSITLAKLASLDQNTATDTMIAAWKQAQEMVDSTGQKLESSSQLLDKWVNVSRNANVDVGTLATTFAIVGESAAGAGLNIDELNGLIATLSEKTALSAKETGTAVRAIIAGFTTDAAVKELEKFGIAVTDAQGKTRDFKTVFGEIKAFSDSGIISPDQLNKIAYAIGGGNRRQAQAVISITGQERMQQVAGYSTNAPIGGAEKAMETLIDTIAGSINALNIAFSKLSQTLGVEGGLLGTINAVIKGATGLVDILTGVTKALGGGLPLIAGMGLSSMMFKPGSKGNIFSQMGNEPGGINPVQIKFWAADFASWVGKSEIGKQIGSTFGSAAKTMAPATGALIAVGLAAAMKGANGDWAEAGIVLATTAAGALIGGAAGVPTVGVVVGSMIGEAFAASVERNKNRISAALAQGGPPKPITFGEPPAIPSQLKETKIPYRSLVAAYGKNAGANVSPEQAKRDTDIINELAQGILEQYNEFITKPENQTGMIAATGGIPQNIDINAILDYITTHKYTPGQPFNFQVGNFKSTDLTAPINAAGYGKIIPPSGNILNKRENIPTPEEYDKLYNTATTVQPTQYAQNVTLFGEARREGIKALAEAAKKDVEEVYNKGQLSVKEFATRREQLTSAEGLVSAYSYPLTQIGVTEENAIKGSIKVLAKATQDEQDQLLAQATSYRTIAEAIDKAKLADPNAENIDWVDMYGAKTTKKMSDAEDLMKTRAEDLLKYWTVLDNELANRIQMPTTIDFTPAGYGRKEAELIEQGIQDYIQKRAKQLPEQYQQAFLVGQTRSEPVFIKTIDGITTVFKASSDIIKEFNKELQESGKILKDLQIAGGSLKAAEYTNKDSQFNLLYNDIKKKAESLGFVPQLENIILHTKDDQLIYIIQQDSRLRALAEEQMQKTLDKALNGTYNLPSGASFYVPYQAARMSRTTDEKTKVTKLEGSQEFKGAVTEFGNAVDEFRRDRTLEGRNILTGMEETKKTVETMLEHPTMQNPSSYPYVAPQTNYDPSAGYGQGYAPSKGYYAEPGKQDYQTYADLGQNIGGYGSNNRTNNILQDILGGIHTMSSDLERWIQKIFKISPNAMVPYSYNMGNQMPTQTTGPAGLSGAHNESLNKSLQTKLDIRIDNKVTLVANGRILYEVIKPYMTQDLLTYGGTTPSGSGSYVVG